MREITTPEGKIYARVEVDEKKLRIQLAQHNNVWVQMDARVIPQLRQILAEAEFFKHI